MASHAAWKGHDGTARLLGALSSSAAVEASMNAGSWAALLCLHELVADRIAHQGSGRGQIELAHHRCPVRLHCLEAYIEKLGDLFVRVPLGNQLHHAALSVCKRRS